MIKYDVIPNSRQRQGNLFYLSYFLVDAKSFVFQFLIEQAMTAKVVKFFMQQFIYKQ